MKKILALILSCIVVIAHAEPAAVNNEAEGLQAKLNALKTMTASFTQKVSSGKRAVSETSGTMALARPGKFRWETKDPLQQLVIADSQRLWVYDVDLEQVTVKKQEKGLGGTAALFLSGYDHKIARDFTVKMSVKGDNAVYDLKALSNKENFQKVRLFFAGERLNRIELFDQLGQHTVVNLSNININPVLSSTLFRFKPPKGVDVVEQ